jgi:hypothetical protein
MRTDFEAQRARSREFEAAMTVFLQARGYYTLATYDYSGKADDKAPRLLAVKRGLVIPDVLSFHKDKPGAWFEIKVKANADLYRKTGELVTGLATRHLNAYREVKMLTGMDVWLVFIHEREDVVKACEIDALPLSHQYTGDLMDRGGTTFFQFNKLRPILTTTKLRAMIPASMRAAS